MSPRAGRCRISLANARIDGNHHHMPVDAMKLKMPSKEEALPGRSERVPVAPGHVVTGAPMESPFPRGMERAMFGMGCFWYAEHRFWSIKGVYTTASGYAGGYTPNPIYREIS